jgi:FlaA1/EpsC-like NDP-sugar epimerase
VFVLDMGEPVTIAYLARQMILLSGKTPGVDVEIAFTGLRPGEKLFEELFHPAEALRRSNHEKLLLARFREVDWVRFESDLARLEQVCEAAEEDEVRRVLATLVPEFDGAARGDDKIVPITRARS